MEKQTANDPDFPSGTYQLRYGLYAVIKDSDTPLERTQKAGKCSLTKMSLATCVCWSCRGLSKNPVAAEQRQASR